jgi:hypothetical protein
MTDGPSDLVTEGPDAWWRFHDNVVQLAHHLADTGWEAKNVAHAVEKPWKFEDEYREALIAQAESEASEAGEAGDAD